MKKTKDVTHTPKELLDEMKALLGEAQTMMTEAVSEHSAEALEKLRERFHAAQEQFSEFYADAKTKVVAGAKTTDAAIREHPYQALAISLGVGVLLGVLLSRRSH